MDVVSHCPLTVAGRLYRSRAGAFAYTFVCKATFALAPGKLALAAEQQPVNEVDRPWSDQVTSLHAASDLAPRKLRADVVLIGHAYAPGGVPVQKLVARLAVGGLDKAIEVWCDRTLRADGSVVMGPPFAELPLLYERAAGGPGTDNPVGMAPVRDAYGGVALPNLTPPGARAELSAAIPPSGFGPIAGRWPTRVARLGRSADEQIHEAWQDRPLPPGFDLAYFNVAPADQQPPVLRGGERIVLENLHPRHPKLTMTLPGLRVVATVAGPAGEKPVEVRCDTLWIDTRREICCLSYRGEVVVGSPADAGRVVVTLDEGVRDDAQAGRGRPAHVTGPMDLDDDDLPPRPQAHTVPVMGRGAGSSTSAPPAAVLPFQAAAPRGEVPPARRSDAGGAVVPQASVPLIRFEASAAPTNAASDSPWLLGPKAPGARTVAPVTASAVAQAAPAPGDFRAGGGALLASNAAAGAAETRPARTPEPARPPAVPVPAPNKSRADTLDLVFFDPAGLSRIRRVPAWKKLLAALEDRPLDPEDDDPSAAGDPAEVEERREVMEILLRGDPGNAASIDEALGRAAREDGRFVAPVLLLAGELATPFDELETLKATVAAITPLAGADEAVRASLDIAKDFLKLPGLSSAPAAAEGLSARVREAYSQGKRPVPPATVDAQTERALVEQRAYQKRAVLGGRRLRTLLCSAADGSGSAPPPPVAYLSEAAAPRLPMCPRFKVRLIARAHPGLDPYETSQVALEVLALARLCPPPRMAGARDGEGAGIRTG